MWHEEVCSQACASKSLESHCFRTNEQEATAEPLGSQLCRSDTQTQWGWFSAQASKALLKARCCWADSPSGGARRPFQTRRDVGKVSSCACRTEVLIPLALSARGHTQF